MSETEAGLRAALAQLADQDEPIDPAEIRELLSDRPSEVEPAVCLGDGVCTNPRCERHGMKDTPVVTDEAVEKLARTYYENLGWDWDDLDTDLKDHDENKATILREFRAALEAAAPLLGTRPQPTQTSHEAWHEAHPGYPCEYHPLPKTAADLSALSIAVHRAKRAACPDYGIGDHDCVEHETPAVRPLPTREQIDEERLAGVIHGGSHDSAKTRCAGSDVCQYWRDAELAATRVLALFTGGKE